MTHHHGHSEKMLRAAIAKMESEQFTLVCGGFVQKQNTALRLHNGIVESVEIDENGHIIEPVRCTCGAVISFNCQLHRGIT